MNSLHPREAVAAYVQRALEEIEGKNLAELVRRVSVEIGRERPYARNAGQGWLDEGNAPGEVLVAIHRITGVSLDVFAAAKERPPSTDERLARLEHEYDRLLTEIEQVRREAGQPFRRRDRKVPDDEMAQEE